MPRKRGHCLTETQKDREATPQIKLTYRFGWRIQDDAAGIPHFGQRFTALLVRGAANAANLGLFDIGLRCLGALRFPPLGPAILEPDLGHGAPSSKLK